MTPLRPDEEEVIRAALEWYENGPTMSMEDVEAGKKFPPRPPHEERLSKAVHQWILVEVCRE